MLKITHKGDLSRTTAFLTNASKGRNNILRTLHTYGQKGVQALSMATPVDTGKTASSWSYEVTHSRGSFSICWHNANVTSDGTPVAILLQYGHGTGTGGYVQGVDYINPALRPIFDQMADEVWREVNRA